MIRSFCPKFSLNSLMTPKKFHSLPESLKPQDPRRKPTVILLTYNGKDKLNNKVTTGARSGCSCDEYRIKCRLRSIFLSQLVVNIGVLRPSQNCCQSLCKKGILYWEKKTVHSHKHDRSTCACYIQYATLHLVCTKPHSRAQTNTAAVPTHAVRHHVLDVFIACNRNARAAHPPDSPC